MLGEGCLSGRSGELEISKDLTSSRQSPIMSNFESNSIGRISAWDNLSRFASSKNASPVKGSKTSREENIV